MTVFENRCKIRIIIIYIIIYIIIISPFSFQIQKLSSVITVIVTSGEKIGRINARKFARSEKILYLCNKKETLKTIRERDPEKLSERETLRKNYLRFTPETGKKRVGQSAR